MGYPLPPNERQLADSTSARPRPTGIDGPQWVLEYWSDINNVFQFVRVEDIAYDKRQGDRERRRTSSTRVAVGRPLSRLDTPNFRSTNGRVWKMVFDKKDPTEGHVADGLRRG